MDTFQTLITNLNNLGMFLLGVAGLVWTIISALRHESADHRKQTRSELQADYDRKEADNEKLRKRNDELEQRIVELQEPSQENRTLQELIHCIAEQDILIESLRTDITKVTADRDYWREFVNKHWDTRIVREYTGE